MKDDLLQADRLLTVEERQDITSRNSYSLSTMFSALVKAQDKKSCEKIHAMVMGGSTISSDKGMVWVRFRESDWEGICQK